MYFASLNIDLDSLSLQLSSKFSTPISKSNPFINWDEEKSERVQHISWSCIVSKTQPRIKSKNSKTPIGLGIRIRRVMVLNNIPKLVLYIPIWAWLMSNHYIMIYIPPGPIFQCEFNCNSYDVMGWLHSHNIWYGHHQASFFILHPMVMVIMSFGDHIFAIYDMGIMKHHSFILYLMY